MASGTPRFSIVIPLYNRVLWRLMRLSPALTSWLINVDVTKSGLVGERHGEGDARPR